MITEYSFSAVPEEHPLRRRYTVTVKYRNGHWVVMCDGAYLDGGGVFTDEPVPFDETTAVQLAERVAPTIRLWTQYGEMNAAEALAAGLR